MPQKRRQSFVDRTSSRIERVLARARAALMIERVWPPLAAFLTVLALFLGLSFLGLWRAIPDIARIALVIAFIPLAVVVVRAALRRDKAKPPVDRAAAIARVEASSGLRHQPLSALEDSLSNSAAPGSAETKALWAAHQERARAQIAALRAGSPNPRFFALDRYALRVVAGILFVCGLAAGYGDYGPRLAAAVIGSEKDGPMLRVDIWANPPSYTNRAPLVLSYTDRLASESPAAAVEVPEGSEIIVRVQGDFELLPTLDAGGGPEPLVLAASEEDGAPVSPSDQPSAPRSYTATLTSDAVLAVTQGDEETASWPLTVLPDDAPTIALVDEPTINLNNTFLLEYDIQDDYGAASAHAAYEPLSDPVKEGARALVQPLDHALPLPANRTRTGSARTVRDLTDHPLAGSEVMVTLSVKDQAGQIGEAEPFKLTLPSRVFRNPLAQALVEQRRRLALDARRQVSVLEAIDALTLAPELFSQDYGEYLGMRLVYTNLSGAEDDDALRNVLEELWTLALTIEDGDLSDAERNLRDAQEALRRALEEGASDEEISRLTEELRQAMREYLQALAQNMQNQPQMGEQQMQDGQQLESRDLDEMLDRIEELAQSGARDAAQQMLSELQQMLNNLRAAQQGQMPNGQQSEMNQTMQELSEIIRRQRELMDETYRQQRGDGEQQQQGQGQQGQPGQPGQPGQQGGGQQMTPEQLAEALRQLQEGQGDLAQRLEQLREQLGQMGLSEEQGSAFGDAGDAMGRAEGALGEGQPGQAVGPQGQALDALRRGVDQLSEAMQGEGGQQFQPGSRQQSNRDPLGRPRRTEGPDFGETTKVPEEIDIQRARRVLQELRRRLSNPERPKLELDYLERLLERF